MPQTAYELTRCPVCDALECSEIGDGDAMRAEAALLRAFHERRLRRGVPPSQLADRVEFSQEPPLRLCQCRRCLHVYRNPWERRETLEAAYETEGPAESVLQKLFRLHLPLARGQVRRLTEVVGRRGTGLEIGSYVGGFLSAAQEAGWTFEGVDVSPEAVAFASRVGHRVTLGEIGDVDAAQAFDAVVIWNTFEQLYDARAAIVAARGLLRDAGVLAVRVPNGGFYLTWRGRLEGAGRAAALKVLGHNNLLSFPYRQGFTERSLTRLLGECGFEVVRTFGDTLVPVADRWTTTYGAIEERVVKRLQRLTQRGWNAPWVEVYARRATGGR